MEHTLKCNVLKCRKELSDQALVTTCSHIFCLDCSKRHGLTGQAPDRRKSCPACECQLNNPDDAVVTNLNLTENYKTSVLSGLSPNIIMECAGRALSFWAYQTTQEVIYQRYLEKTLTEKLKILNVKLEKTVGDANADITGLQEKIRALSDDYDDMRRKHEELARSYQDQCRKLTQVQELYDKVKRKADLGQMEAAASDAVDSNLQYGTQLPAFEFPEPAARQNIYEQQSDSAYNNAHSYVGPERGHRRVLAGGGGSGPLREDRAWSKPGPAQGDTISTPRGTPRGHGSGSHGRFGLSTVLGLGTGTGTPMPRGPSGNLPLARHPPISCGRGLGVGLSSGIRTGHISHGSYGSTGRNEAELYSHVKRPGLAPAAFSHLADP